MHLVSDSLELLHSQSPFGFYLGKHGSGEDVHIHPNTCLYVDVCTCVCTCVHACRGQMIFVGVILQDQPTTSMAWSTPHRLAWLTSEPQRSFCLCRPHSGITTAQHEVQVLSSLDLSETHLNDHQFETAVCSVLCGFPL